MEHNGHDGPRKRGKLERKTANMKNWQRITGGGNRIWTSMPRSVTRHPEHIQNDWTANRPTKFSPNHKPYWMSPPTKSLQTWRENGARKKTFHHHGRPNGSTRTPTSTKPVAKTPHALESARILTIANQPLLQPEPLLHYYYLLHYQCH